MSEKKQKLVTIYICVQCPYVRASNDRVSLYCVASDSMVGLTIRAEIPDKCPLRQKDHVLRLGEGV